MSQMMCDYGNCTETMPAKGPFKLTITETRHGTISDRHVFCCYEHAILWLQKRDMNLNKGIRLWRPPTEIRS